MKRKIGYFLVFGMLVMLGTGCTNSIPDMTEEETRMVEEYAAQLLLKYDSNYQASILDETQMQEAEEDLIHRAEVAVQIEQMKEAQEEEESEEDDTEPDVPEEPAYTDIDTFFTLDGLDIVCDNWSVTDVYPITVSENDWQGVSRATNGNDLVAFEFTITNLTDADYYLDMASEDVNISFKINDSITKAALTTLLTNDFIMYRDTIPAGQSATAVLLIELSEEDAQALTNIVMIMKYNGVRAETTIL